MDACRYQVHVINFFFQLTLLQMQDFKLLRVIRYYKLTVSAEWLK